MQVKTKTFVRSILLLALPGAVFATPENAATIRYVKASAMGMSKRNLFTFSIQPQYMAMPLNANPFVKRQSGCGLSAKECYDGCCNIGTVCGIYGGEKGCCPVGKNCNSVSGCQNSDDVSCGSFCCPSGTTCDSTGGTCNKSGTDDSGNNGNSGSQCDPGYSACTLFDGCCPTGAKCVLPKNCGVPCTSDDTLCGNGCCQKGTYCTSDETCAKDNTDSFTTLVQTTRIITTQTTELTTDYPTATLDSSTTDLSSPTNFFPNGNSDSTSRSTSTTTTVPTTVTRRTIATVNAAPTMGAILGGGLGMAAGVLGALAM